MIVENWNSFSFMYTVFRKQLILTYEKQKERNSST